MKDRRKEREVKYWRKSEMRGMKEEMVEGVMREEGKRRGEIKRKIDEKSERLNIAEKRGMR